MYMYMGKLLGDFQSAKFDCGKICFFFISRAKKHESNTYPKRLFEAYFEAFCDFWGEPYVVQYSSAVGFFYIAYFTPFVL